MQQMEAQLAAINSRIAELNGTLKQLPDLQRRYLQLYREVEVKQQLYTALLNSYQQLRIAKAGEIGNVRIVDTAVEPLKPIAPKKLQILILSIFLGGFLGTLIALLRNMMRSGIKDAAQIENELDIPVYATVPRSAIQESRVKLLKKKKTIPILAVKDSDDIAVESIRSIRTESPDPRLINKVPPPFASLPSSGHCSISALARKNTRALEPSTAISSQDT